jgi:hypothetical protein
MQQPVHQLRTFSFVTQTEILLVWLIYTLLVGLLLMIPSNNYLSVLTGALWVLIAIPFFQYGFTIIEFTARGHSNIPRMGSDIFTMDSRVYKLMLYLAMTASFLVAVPDNLDYLAEMFIAIITPAIITFISFHYSAAQAVNPLNIYRFISNMGFTYNALKFLGAWVLAALLFMFGDGLNLYDSKAGSFLMAAASIYLVLTLFRATGVLLHHRRGKIGIHADFSRELEEEKLLKQQHIRRQHLISKLQKLANVDKIIEAGNLLNRSLKRNRYLEEELYFDLLSNLEDQRLAHKMAQGYIGRLLHDDQALAWHIFDTVCDETRGKFRLESGSDLLNLATIATDNSQKRRVLLLLSNFDDNYPKHPRSREAFLVATEICIELGQHNEAQSYFQKVTSRRGRLNRVKYEKCLEILGPTFKPLRQ